MNFINLTEAIKNEISAATYYRLLDDFMDAWRDALKGIKPCKSAADKAIKNYIAGAQYKDDTTRGVYSDGATALILPANMFVNDTAINSGIISNGIAKTITDLLKNKRPTTCDFLESYALYKVFKKWDKDTEYFLKIDGFYYNPDLVFECLDCIATNKKGYISAEISNGDGLKGALFIRQDGGTALVLPIAREDCHPSQNINFKDFMTYTDGVFKALTDKEIKTA